MTRWYSLLVCSLVCGIYFATPKPLYAQQQERVFIARDVATNQLAESPADELVATPSKPAQHNENSVKQAWDNFVPPPDNYDWIQLTSGEWLKGDLKVLYNDQLDFDSDELGLQRFDIQDIKRIRGHGVKGVRIDGTAIAVDGGSDHPEPITVYGTLEVTQDKVIVTSGQSTQVFERSRLVAIVSGENKESDFWSAKINLGLNLTGGNTTQVDYSAMVKVARRTAATRFLLNYLGNYSRVNDVDTVDNSRLNANFDVFKTRKYFWRAAFGEYFRDPFQNIESRYTLGSGLGYHIINTAKTEWDLTVGLAYQKTHFNSVESGEDPKVSTPALAVSTKYDTDLTTSMDFSVDYSFNLVNEASGTYTHHFITTLETEFTSWLDFDISFVWDRIQDPTANADGTVPKRDDYNLIFSLGIEY